MSGDAGQLPDRSKHILSRADEVSTVGQSPCPAMRKIQIKVYEDLANQLSYSMLYKSSLSHTYVQRTKMLEQNRQGMDWRLKEVGPGQLW